jgi:hypothetical protein
MGKRLYNIFCTNTYLIAFLDLDFEELVNSFLIVKGVHDRQVDRPTQVDEVGLCTIFDAFFLRDHCMI